jgi:3-oxoacyl-[acyl-carrier-protein] synthase II
VTDANRAACVLGMGCVTPLGPSIPAFTAALRAARSGVTRLPFSHPKVRCAAAAPVPVSQFDPRSTLPEADLARLPRLVPMALHAAREALAAAGLLGPEARLSNADPQRIGLVLGTGGGGIDFTLDQFTRDRDGGRASLWTITNATHGNLAGELSIRLGLQGPSWCLSTGCASSSDAAAAALAMLRERGGRSTAAAGLDAVLVVGADAHVRWETLHAMELLGVINTAPIAEFHHDPTALSRPFDARRKGFILGEGAWAMLLARPGWLPKVPPLARLTGAASTCDAFHRVRPAPDMAQCIRALLAAVADADALPAEVDVIHYHGTSTELNDALESAAVRAAFGEHAPRLAGHSVKGAIGHPQGAAGMAALVASLAALRGADGLPPFLLPTLNLTTPDPACDLDYTPLHPRPVTIPQRGLNLLVNCLAFGARNTALLLHVPPG